MAAFRPGGTGPSCETDTGRGRKFYARGQHDGPPAQPERERETLDRDGTGRPRQWKTCGHCGKRYRTRNPKREYCGPQCRAAAQQARYRERKRETITE